MPEFIAPALVVTFVYVLAFVIGIVLLYVSDWVHRA